MQFRLGFWSQLHPSLGDCGRVTGPFLASALPSIKYILFSVRAFLIFCHSRRVSRVPLAFLLLGKTELAKQTAKYMHKDAKKVRAGHGDRVTSASPKILAPWIWQ